MGLRKLGLNNLIDDCCALEEKIMASHFRIPDPIVEETPGNRSQKERATDPLL